MRTTLSIDEDVPESARYLAKKSHKSLGQIVSELTRLGLEGSDRNRSVYRRLDGDARPRSARNLKSWGRFLSRRYMASLSPTRSSIESGNLKASGQVATLLDVNVLIALCDADHVGHHRAALWFSVACR